MFRSLFSRLAATHLAIALVSVLAMGLLLGGLLQSFLFREKERTLMRYGHEIIEMASRLPGFPDNRQQAQVFLAAVDRLVGARIWIVTADGTVTADSFAGAPIHPAIHLEREEIQRILSGQTVTKRGFFRGRFRVPVISVGLPLRTGGRPTGAIFLHSPVFGVRFALFQIYRLVVWAALAAGAVALGLGLWLSRRMSRPLREMSEAAQALAQGQFDQRVSLPAGDDEIGRLAASFNHMAAQLGDLERLRREFIANVSHELRSPLTSMRGFLQGVLDGTVPPEERERYLGLAFDETRRLSRLVNDLLDLTALESGDAHFQMTDVDTPVVLRRVAAKMEPQAADKGLGLTLDLPPSGPGPVLADPDRMEQVLFNLLDNAIRFTPQGGTVTLLARDHDGAVEIVVSDTGPGIPPEDLERLWERFFKSDRARTRSKGGTGLGLAITKELVERQGGTIKVESHVGQGTTFFVSLPAAPAT